MSELDEIKKEIDCIKHEIIAEKTRLKEEQDAHRPIDRSYLIALTNQLTQLTALQNTLIGAKKGIIFNDFEYAL